MNNEDCLLQNVEIKLYPKPTSFKILKNKYKKQIEQFFSDLINDKIAYTKYTKQIKNSRLKIQDSELKDFYDFDHIITVGIGGIINGTKSIFHTLTDRMNEKEIVFIDNIGFKQFEYLQKLKNHFNPKKDILVLVSKSGTTLETLIESSFFIDLLPNFIKNKRTIIITSESNQFLDNFAKQNGLYIHFLPKDLGGRFSHFYSSILPLTLSNINKNNIFNSAIKFIKQVENYRNKSKFLHFTLNLFHNINEYNLSNIIILNYIDKLNSLADFCVQLWDESLGKINSKGIRFPTTMINALCPKEQHSQLQAFLEGAHNKMLFFFVPSHKFKSIGFKDSLFYNRKFTLTEILNAQAKGVLGSFIKEGLPVVWFEIDELNEPFIGEFLAFFSLLVILGGYLNELNPFNQNAVELYKKLTRSYLNLDKTIIQDTQLYRI